MFKCTQASELLHTICMCAWACLAGDACLFVRPALWPTQSILFTNIYVSYAILIWWCRRCTPAVGLKGCYPTSNSSIHLPSVSIYRQEHSTVAHNVCKLPTGEYLRSFCDLWLPAVSWDAGHRVISSLIVCMSRGVMWLPRRQIYIDRPIAVASS